MNEFFHRLYADWGMDAQWQSVFSWTAALVCVAILSYLLSWLVRGGIGGWIGRVASRTQNQWDDFLFNKKFFSRLGALLPSVASYILFVSLVTADDLVFPLLRKTILLLICVTGTGFLDQLLSNAEKGFLAIVGDKKVPIRSYAQVLKIFLFLVAGILIFAVILDQNPLGILTGLGALTAVLLLVFKDSLLGFVASLQVNTNNLVQTGDWIEFPGQDIAGEVIDIALSVVKIKGGDNTVFSLPTYNLVSQPFKNWRNVKELGARRLKLSFSIDATTLVLVDAAMEASQRTAGLWRVPDARTGVTNLEAYRFWAQSDLEAQNEVHPDLVRLVKLGDPAGQGIPVEMIFHSRTTEYPDWEHLHSRLLCHYLAALPAFGLRLFQGPTGR